MVPAPVNELVASRAGEASRTGPVLVRSGSSFMTRAATSARTVVTTPIWKMDETAMLNDSWMPFTIVVQNAVPFSQLGVATSNLTFFRQIGGSVGLAITGTVFGSRLVDELPTQLSAAGVPQQAVAQFAGQSTAALDDLVGVGGDLGAQILASVPAAFQDAVKPLIPAIVQGIHEAFSIAVSSIFQIGVVTTVLALVAALVMKELPLRSSTGPAPEAAPAGEPTGALTGARATD